MSMHEPGQAPEAVAVRRCAGGRQMTMQKLPTEMQIWFRKGHDVAACHVIAHFSFNRQKAADVPENLCHKTVRPDTLTYVAHNLTRRTSACTRT